MEFAFFQVSERNVRNGNCRTMSPISLVNYVYDLCEDTYNQNGLQTFSFRAVLLALNLYDTWLPHRSASHTYRWKDIRHLRSQG